MQNIKETDILFQSMSISSPLSSPLSHSQPKISALTHTNPISNYFYLYLHLSQFRRLICFVVRSSAEERNACVKCSSYSDEQQTEIRRRAMHEVWANSLDTSTTMMEMGRRREYGTKENDQVKEQLVKFLCQRYQNSSFSTSFFLCCCCCVRAIE